MEPYSISRRTLRRFVLGRQGLWPGRRWRGKEGAAAAMRQGEALQLDPLNVIARSQDITLHSRVLDYQPVHLDELLYQERRFFDYGGALFVYPMEELPHWRFHMQYRQKEGRWARLAQENPELIEQVRAALRANGPLGNRDLEGNQRVNSYRGRKDTSLALYCLWITGETMVHHRENFQRKYAFREQIVPQEVDIHVTEAEASAYFSRKPVAHLGVINDLEWKNSLGDYLGRRIEATEAQTRLAALVEAGVLHPVEVEGFNRRRQWYVLAEDAPVLETLDAGNYPPEWQPLDTTTDEEVVFLAPLDIVSARGRAKKVFDFDYVWEVYKPVEQRRWGYYTLPVLYGDRLVARLDPKLERDTMTLRMHGFWLEPDAPQDEAFRSAFGRGLERFLNFLGARQVAVVPGVEIPLDKGQFSFTIK